MENRIACLSLMEALQRSGLFPGPSVEKEHAFTKSLSYLSFGTHLADVDAATLEAVFETLVAIKDRAISIRVDRVSRLQSYLQDGRTVVLADSREATSKPGAHQTQPGHVVTLITPYFIPVA